MSPSTYVTTPAILVVSATNSLVGIWHPQGTCDKETCRLYAHKADPDCTHAEFDFRVVGDGRSAVARYANNSNYRNDSLIRKEMCVSSLVVDEIKRIVKSSEIMKEDDSKWPQKNKDGRQELEIRLGTEHISFEVRHNHRIATNPTEHISMLTREGAPRIDGQDWLINRRHRVGRSRRPSCLLLLSTRPEGASFQLDIASLQDQAYLIRDGVLYGRN
ncbi:hypothetical protein O1611_g697 [Lasiodiplodia mahajangana]|uniref:Uncharacterized protein n=1 Tax=Lasiodiplodia mahajangana TaxID=1108764 RepID=A0ACC2K040_9PEZI|nr:hypothetical protein O1611_g697 [Lasiodiplodia mahajangana]